MKFAIIERYYGDSGKNILLSHLLDNNGLFICDILERYNKHVPLSSEIGENYYYIWKYTPKHRNGCYHITNSDKTFNARMFELHVGNTIKDSQGCQLCGLRTQYTATLKMSKITLDCIHKTFGDEIEVSVRKSLSYYEPTYYVQNFIND